MTGSGDQDLEPSTTATASVLLAEAVAVVDALRERDAWCAAQTHATLARYALEEGHEVAAAAEAVTDAPAAPGSGDPAALTALRDELGDLLLQVVLHARLASEHEGGFDLADVAAAMVDKAHRRHPHVFAGADPLRPTGGTAARVGDSRSQAARAT